MNWRIRIADWISGGELTRWRNVKGVLDWAINRLDKQQELNGENMVRLSKARYALRNIAALETPNANATVKRMARIAREALE